MPQAHSAEAAVDDPGSTPSRESLKRRLFGRCDRDGDGVLNKAEMREFAGLVGFEGTDAEWDDEYKKLCGEQRLDPLRAVPQETILRLLDDRSDSGCFCTDAELVQLLAMAPAPKLLAAPAKARTANLDAHRRSIVEGLPALEPGNTQVFFAGANFNTMEGHLRGVFAGVGELEDFQLFRLLSGRSRGMGRATYATAREAEFAIADLHQKEVDGRVLLVTWHSDDSDGGALSKRSARLVSAGMVSGKGSGKGTRQRWWGGAEEAEQNDEDVDDDWDWNDDVGSEDFRDFEENSGWSESNDGRTVFFAGASFETSAGFLRRTFEECGRISQFWLFQLPDGRSRGMGVVEYESTSEAQFAVRQMHSTEVDGRELLVIFDVVGSLDDHGRQRGYPKETRRQPGGKRKAVGAGSSTARAAERATYEGAPEPYSNRVFFAGAAFEVPEARIRAHLEEIAPLRSFTCFKLWDGRHRGMGVATYETSDFAAAALQKGVIVDGRPLHLQEDTSQYALDAAGREQVLATSLPKLTKHSVARGQKRPAPYGPRSSGVPAKRPNPAKAVFFANVPFETTETHLRCRFEAAGPVRSLTVFTTPDGKSRGMGVVEFQKVASAKRAYRSLRKRKVSGRSLVVEEYRPPSAG